MKVAVVYHSETGNTRRMAELIKEGAESVKGVEAKAMGLDGIDSRYLQQARVVAFGCPTYEGTCSWQMKKLLDTPGLPLAGKLGEQAGQQHRTHPSQSRGQQCSTR